MRLTTRILHDAGPPLFLLAALGAIWQVASGTGLLNSGVLPAPTDIGSAFVNQATLLGEHAATTTVEAIAGFLLGNATALALAVLFVHSRAAERGIYPIVIGARSVPVVALAPVLVLWLGFGLMPKILIASFLTFFPTLVNAVRGLRAMDMDVDELMQVLSATRRQVLWKVRLPSSLPYLFSAFRIGAGISFVGAIVAEWIGSDHGLGYLIVVSASQYDLALMWAAVAVAATAALVMFGAVVMTEHLVTPWAHKADTEVP